MHKIISMLKKHNRKIKKAFLLVLTLYLIIFPLQERMIFCGGHQGLLRDFLPKDHTFTKNFVGKKTKEKLYYKMIETNSEIELLSEDEKEREKYRKIVAGEKIMIVFHGNGQRVGRLSIKEYIDLFEVNVVIVGYRREFSWRKVRNENEFYDEAEDLLAEIKKKGYKEKNIYIHGHSLGSAPSIHLSSQNKELGGLILVGAFTGVDNLVPRLLNKLLRYNLRSIDKIGKVNCPIIIIHGRKDYQIRISNGLRLWEKAKEQRGSDDDLVFYPYDGGHSLPSKDVHIKALKLSSIPILK